MLLKSPWELPVNYRDQVLDLMAEKDPYLFTRSQPDPHYPHDEWGEEYVSSDRQKALQSIQTTKSSIVVLLNRIHKFTSHAFHVLIRELIPGAKADKSNLFTMIKEHRNQYMIQARENVTMSISTTNYYEPYFLSGAKLTWQQSKKLLVQVNAFNSFSQYLETNKNKVIGLSIVYNPTSKIAGVFTSMFCDETPNGKPQKHKRLYNNFCLTYKSKRWIVGLEANFGLQTNSVLADSTKTAFVFSNLLLAKYRITPQWAMYARGEIFSDPNEILTGPVENQNHEIVGLDAAGATCGIEFKPIPNSYLRVESRYLQTKKSESIFYYNNTPQNYRLEFIVGLGLWF